MRQRESVCFSSSLWTLTDHIKCLRSADDDDAFAFQASGKNLNLNDESQHGLLMQLLKLSYNCLNYDFIGTSTDESSDDLCTVQIPTSWRSGRGARHARRLQINVALLLRFTD